MFTRFNDLQEVPFGKRTPATSGYDGTLSALIGYIKKAINDFMTEIPVDLGTTTYLHTTVSLASCLRIELALKALS